jgi:hypothetical protein
MRPLTLKTLNKHLMSLGFTEELVKGKGYFYFDGPDVGHFERTGVYVYRLNQLNLDQWVAELEELRAAAGLTTEKTMLNGPIVNLNGAMRDSLIKQHHAVSDAAEDLLRRMRQAMPHGRDYQTARPPVTYQSDRDEWERMARNVDEVLQAYRRITERLATEEK